MHRKQAGHKYKGLGTHQKKRLKGSKVQRFKVKNQEKILYIFLYSNSQFSTLNSQLLKVCPACFRSLYLSFFSLSIVHCPLSIVFGNVPLLWLFGVLYYFTYFLILLFPYCLVYTVLGRYIVI